MTNPTRYGTSCAEHPEGCFVKFSDYEKVAAERDALRAERDHWKANHDNQVSRARFLIERGDIPVERVRAYHLMGALLEVEAAVRDQRAMFEDTSDEFNMSGTNITHALDILDAERAKEQA